MPRSSTPYYLKDLRHWGQGGREKHTRNPKIHYRSSKEEQLLLLTSPEFASDPVSSLHQCSVLGVRMVPARSSWGPGFQGQTALWGGGMHSHSLVKPRTEEMVCLNWIEVAKINSLSNRFLTFTRNHFAALIFKGFYL